MYINILFAYLAGLVWSHPVRSRWDKSIQNKYERSYIDAQDWASFEREREGKIERKRERERDRERGGRGRECSIVFTLAVLWAFNDLPNIPSPKIFDNKLNILNVKQSY